jgi:TolB-like protein
VNPRNFFSELKRRNVYRVAVAYAVVAWLLIQIATQVFPFFEIPDWAVRLVVLLLALGFPVALVLAWAFELTPEGIQLTVGGREEGAARKRMRRPLFWSLIGLGGVAALFLSIHLFRTPSAVPAQGKEAGQPPGRRAVAVLPFENLSEDKANAYFADGMQDEIITRLARIGDLKVISRTSTMPYRAKPEKISEIARQLGVGHVVEGSVQRIAERVRINVQLIDAATDDHLWAELYDRNVADVFAVQSEVATKIADSLQAKLSGREQKAMAQKLTENMAAYDAYLRGIDFFSRPGQTADDQRNAAEAFAEATRLDPNFAEAWARLSGVCSALFIQNIDKTAAGQELARSAAETATRLAPDSPDTLMANAYYRYQVLRDYAGARELFEKIRREVPSSSEAVAALARIARRQNRWVESMRLYEEAAKLNPRDGHLVMDRAWTFSMVRDYDRTRELLERAEAIASGDADVLGNKAWFFQWKGDLPAARAVLDAIPRSLQTAELRVNQLLYERRFAEAAPMLEEKLAAPEKLQPHDRAISQQWLGWIRTFVGDTEGARRAFLDAKPELERLVREQPENIFIAGALALTEAGLGNKEAALREGERAMRALPASEDAVYGPIAEETLAAIEALLGEHDRAIDRIERLLHTPYGAFPLTVAKLRLDPNWDSLREHPRFKAIVEGPEPKTIYQ